MYLTLDELKRVQKEQFIKLLGLAGGVSHLSKMLNLPYTVVRGWYLRGKVSKEGARSIEAHPTLGKHFKAVELRPDL